MFGNDLFLALLCLCPVIIDRPNARMLEVTDLFPRIYLPVMGGCVRVEVVLLGSPKTTRIIWISPPKWQIPDSILRSQSVPHSHRYRRLSETHHPSL